MVSLAPNIISSTGDGEGSTGSAEVPEVMINDRQMLLQPVVGERRRLEGKVDTLPVAVLLVVLTLTMGAMVTVLAVIWPLNDKRECESYFMSLYIHCIYWSFCFIIDCYLRRKHTESRIEGYLEFYNEVIKHSRGPFYITTISNAVILSMAVIFQQHYGDMKGHCAGNLMDPLHYVSSFIVMEAAIISTVLVVYIIKVRRFNKQRAKPDALRDEWMASFIRESYSGGEIGYRERENHTCDLLEKQADLLRYLKEQNAKLVQKVMILKLQLQEKHGASIT